jgi:hypothetical protein
VVQSESWFVRVSAQNWSFKLIRIEGFSANTSSYDCHYADQCNLTGLANQIVPKRNHIALSNRQPRIESYCISKARSYYGPLPPPPPQGLHHPVMLSTPMSMTTIIFGCRNCVFMEIISRLLMALTPLATHYIVVLAHR